MPWLIFICHAAGSDNLYAEQISKLLELVTIYYYLFSVFIHSAVSSMGNIQFIILILMSTTWKHWFYLTAFNTPGGVFLLIASSAINLLLAWYKRFGANWCFAYATGETFLMPLSRLVFHFLCAYEVGENNRMKKCAIKIDSFQFICY